jgi:hypothetical protein
LEQYFRPKVSWSAATPRTFPRWPTEESGRRSAVCAVLIFRAGQSPKPMARKLSAGQALGNVDGRETSSRSGSGVGQEDCVRCSAAEGARCTSPHSGVVEVNFQGAPPTMHWVVDLTRQSGAKIRRLRRAVSEVEGRGGTISLFCSAGPFRGRPLYVIACDRVAPFARLTCPVNRTSLEWIGACPEGLCLSRWKEER